MLLGAVIAAFGGLLGSWLGYRARNNQSPLPQLPSLRRMIDVVLRRKRPVVKLNGTPMKKQRS